MERIFTNFYKLVSNKMILDPLMGIILCLSISSILIIYGYLSFKKDCKRSVQYRHDIQRNKLIFLEINHQDHKKMNGEEEQKEGIILICLGGSIMFTGVSLLIVHIYFVNVFVDLLIFGGFAYLSCFIAGIIIKSLKYD